MADGADELVPVLTLQASERKPLAFDQVVVLSDQPSGLNLVKITR